MTHAFVDTLVMIAELDVKLDRIDEFLDYTIANLELSRSYPAISSSISSSMKPGPAGSYSMKSGDRRPPSKPIWPGGYRLVT